MSAGRGARPVHADPVRADPVRAFLASMAAERGAAANTLDAYRRDLADWERFLGRPRRESA